MKIIFKKLKIKLKKKIKRYRIILHERKIRHVVTIFSLFNYNVKLNAKTNELIKKQIENKMTKEQMKTKIRTVKTP